MLECLREKTLKICIPKLKVLGLGNWENLDKIFVNVCGIDLAGGVTVIESEEALTFRAMIRQAKETIVVTDSSKLGAVSPALVCPISNIHMLITDTRPTKPSRCLPNAVWK